MTMLISYQQWTCFSRTQSSIHMSWKYLFVFYISRYQSTIPQGIPGKINLNNLILEKKICYSIILATGKSTAMLHRAKARYEMLHLSLSSFIALSSDFFSSSTISFFRLATSSAQTLVFLTKIDFQFWTDLSVHDSMYLLTASTSIVSSLISFWLTKYFSIAVCVIWAKMFLITA